MGGRDSKKHEVLIVLSKMSAHVPIDVTEDVVTDVTVNNQGVHTSLDTVIVVVVEDILIGEGNKSRNSHANVDPAELKPEEEPVLGMEDIDEGNHESKGISDASEQNAILEQVTSTQDLLNQFIYEINFVTPSEACGPLVVGNDVLQDVCVFDMIFVGASTVTDLYVSHNVYRRPPFTWSMNMACFGRRTHMSWKRRTLSPTCREKRTSHKHNKTDSQVQYG